MAETKAEKAVRIIREGRLTVELVREDGYIQATCRGSDTIYALGFDSRRREWRCTCEANRQFHRECAHLLALQLVTVRPPPG